MGIAEFLTLAGQYGFFNVLTAVIVLTCLLVWRSRSSTNNHVHKTEADSIAVLAKAITDLAAGISQGNSDARRERQENLMSIKELTGELKGMMVIIGDNTKATKATSTHIHELSDQIPQIKTDLHDLATHATALTGELNKQFKPMNDLLVSFGEQLTTLVSQCKLILDLITNMQKGPINDDPLEAQTD